MFKNVTTCRPMGELIIFRGAEHGWDAVVVEFIANDLQDTTLAFKQPMADNKTGIPMWFPALISVIPGMKFNMLSYYL